MVILFKVAIWLAALTPLGWMIYQGLSDQLGPDPGKAFVDGLGLWTLRLLLITLLLRPLRDITNKSVFIRVRRLVGLFCWFYATLHFAASIFYVIGYSWADLIKAFTDKAYIALGLSAWLLLLPLGVTSNRWSQRRLGRRWARLHRAIYWVVVLGCLHFVWLVRSDYGEALFYCACSVLLLCWRVPSLNRAIIERLRVWRSCTSG